jgi:phosphoglycolate phosphatase
LARPQIAGILFDKDGTLFDFEATWCAVVEAALDAVAPDRATRVAMAEAGGYQPDVRRFVPGSALVVGATAEVAALWARFRPDLGAARIERLLDDTGVAVLADPQALRPAVADLPGLLAGLRADGYALGVATNDSERSARLQLEIAGAADAFDFVAGYDSGHGPKPGPGMLLAFAAATGIDPAQVVVVGDGRHDIELARNAGAAMVVAVLTGPATRDDLAPHADHILPSIEHLPALLAEWRNETRCGGHSG